MRRRPRVRAAGVLALGLVLTACGSTGPVTPTPSTDPSLSLRPPATASLSVGPAPDATTTVPFATSSATARTTVPPGPAPVDVADCATLAAHRSDRAADLGLAVEQGTDPAAFARDHTAAPARWVRELTDVGTALAHVTALGYPAGHPLVQDLRAWQTALQTLFAEAAANAADTFRADYVAVQTAVDQWTFDAAGRCS